jgi:asparagine N-glycosylation enzyme membrane subunit Stt3
MRWLALGFGLGFVLPLAVLLTSFYLFPAFDPRRQAISVAGNMALLILPLCLAIGILRYRLFDIDVIIRRTTSYALITGLLALVYFGSIVVLQGLLSPFTGDSTPAVVLSTLLIAALFLPVRRRVQDAIDRRFNRTRYDAEKTLAAFAATARDETDLDALLAELARVIQETMQPEHVSVWLRPVQSPRPPGEG